MIVAFPGHTHLLFEMFYLHYGGVDIESQTLQLF